MCTWKHRDWASPGSARCWGLPCSSPSPRRQQGLAAGPGSRTGALLSFSRAEVSPRVSQWQVLSWHFPVAGTMWGFPRDPGLNVSKVRQGLHSDATAMALASFHPCCKKLTIISHWSNSFNFLVVPFDLNCRLTETQVGYSKLHTK